MVPSESYPGFQDTNVQILSFCLSYVAIDLCMQEFLSRFGSETKTEQHTLLRQNLFQESITISVVGERYLKRAGVNTNRVVLHVAHDQGGTDAHLL